MDFSKRLKSRFWSLFPRHAVAPFRFELRMLKLRRRASLARRRYRGARDLRDAGFGKAVEQRFGVSVDQRLILDQPSRAAESLYVEAAKG